MTNRRSADLLGVLAEGIIPPDDVDGGAREVGAGERLAEKLQGGPAAELYRQGLETARSMAEEEHGRDLDALGAEDVHALLGRLRERAPAFFKQLRMDVTGLYMSDPGVWRRIGFPGPSIQSGGHPDFDQPQGGPATGKNGS